MADSDQARWIVVAPARLRLRRWDDEVVVYDDRSGDTHLLDDAGGRVLERLVAGSASEEELEALCPEESGAARTRPAVLYDVLSRLQRLDLTKPLRK